MMYGEFRPKADIGSSYGNAKESLIKWEIIKEINAPCADISYQWNSEKNARLIVVLHFSRVIEGFRKDLEITFSDPVALQWEDESYGLIDLPENLPKCSKRGFERYTFPTLILDNSEWAKRYAAMTHTADEYRNHKLTHFAFVSMDDLLHVLSEQKPRAKLI